MGFIRKAANAVLPFGLVGNALLNNKKKDGPRPQPVSLLTAGSPEPRPSLVSRNY